MTLSTLRVGLFGAPLDTGNLGVTALCYSLITGILSRVPGAEISIFDSVPGVRAEQLRSNGHILEFKRYGAAASRRFYRPENIWNMRLSAYLGGLAHRRARALLNADAILDISGGDSFAELYGWRRFRAVSMFKLMALECGVPLILPPQTYGPFVTDCGRQLAKRIVRRSAMAWGRDERSYAVLKDLLGDEFDLTRHYCGVDVAFRLTPERWSSALPSTLERWLADWRHTIVGINISGLIYNDPSAAARRYGLRANYPAAIAGLMRRLLSESDCNIVLVPHVLPPPGFEYESDPIACRAVASQLQDEYSHRILMLPVNHDPREVKWFIGQLDWFCGTRMHSTIAALSSGVPTAAIAYSLKTLGVFESCDQGNCVADLRTLDTEELITHLWCSWLGRTIAKERLSSALPEVRKQVKAQMDRILYACSNSFPHSTSAEATE